ncbi:hypothetical protein ABZ235_39735 [Streptomyces canus]|uniref:hypothetical protein n=1 Tax=Streptomyces canus TaxID=58343 RepID=UPI0033A44012
MALTAFVQQWGAAEVEPLVRAADGSQLTDELLDSLQQTTDSLRAMDASTGSGTLAKLGDAHRAFPDVRLGAGALSYMAIHGYSTGSPRTAVIAASAAREKIRNLGTPALEARLLTRQFVRPRRRC